MSCQDGSKNTPKTIKQGKTLHGVLTLEDLANRSVPQRHQSKYQNCKTYWQEILESHCRSARMLSKPTSPAHTDSTCVRPFGCSCRATPEFLPAALALPLYHSVQCRSYKHRKVSKHKLAVPAKNARVDTEPKTGQHCAKTGHHA